MTASAPLQTVSSFDSAHVEKLCCSLQNKDTKLTSLNLGIERNSALAFEPLMDALKHNTTVLDISLAFSELLGPHYVAIGNMMQENQTIRSIALTRTPNYGLRLNDNTNTDCGLAIVLESLQRNFSLQKISLSGLPMGAAIITMLDLFQVNRSIEELNLEDDCLSSHQAIILAQGLANNHTLRKLSIKSRAMDAHGATTIFRAVSTSNLTALTLKWDMTQKGTPYVDSRALQQMVQASVFLQELDLAYWCGEKTEILDEGDNIAVALVAGLANNRSLRRLFLKNIAIGDRGACAFGALLESNMTLKELDLSGNLIGAVGGEALARGLLRNRVLDRLDLSENNLQGAAESIAVSLGTNQSLTMLSLSRHSVDEGNSNLSLTDQALQDRGVAAMAKVLMRNTTLKCLRLIGIRVSVTSAKRLRVSLQRNTVLTEIGLPRPNSMKGLHHLVKAVERNMNLQKVDWSGGWMTCPGSLEEITESREVISRCSLRNKIALQLLRMNIPPSLWSMILERGHSQFGIGLVYHLLREKAEIVADPSSLKRVTYTRSTQSRF